MISLLTVIIIYYYVESYVFTLYLIIEILILMVTLKFIYIGNYYNDIYPSIIALIIIILAGAESAIGLSILVSYYKLRGKITKIL